MELFRGSILSWLELRWRLLEPRDWKGQVSGCTGATSGRRRNCRHKQCFSYPISNFY